MIYGYLANCQRSSWGTYVLSLPGRPSQPNQSHLRDWTLGQDGNIVMELPQTEVREYGGEVLCWLQWLAL